MIEMDMDMEMEIVVVYCKKDSQLGEAIYLIVIVQVFYFISDC